jgi:hypothetical protein
MIGQLERLPASAERDRMLREVRARVVDVDTGAVPRTLPPPDQAWVYEAEPGSPATRPSRAGSPSPAGEVRLPRRPGASPQPARPAHVPPPVDNEDAELAFGVNELLSLDDSASEPEAGSNAAPWTRGLRG